MITLQQLSYSIDHQALLSNINLSFKDSCITGIMGMNGAGKTTLVNLISGLIFPTQGSIRLFDKKTTQYTEKQRAKIISYVPQDTRVHYDFTALDIVLMGRYSYSKAFSDYSQADYRLAHQMMEALDIAYLKDRYMPQLSGGESSRVMIGRALVSQAPIIIMDETIAHLDISHKLYIMNLCKGLIKQGKTILLVLHDLQLAYQFCDYILFLKEGKLYGYGKPEEMFTPEKIKEVFEVRMEWKEGSFMEITV